MNIDSFDDLDRRIVHALQIDARAPFAQIAGVLGVSDQTVARRYARLRAAGKVRVVGMPSVRALRQAWWEVRLECVPGTARGMGEVLARRDDTLWVSLLSGGAELGFGVRSAEDESPLLERLPRTRGVVRMTAHRHLHTFFGGPLGLVNKSGALTAEQVELLRSPGPAEEGPAGPLDASDRPLIAELMRDGRMPVTELARAIGWSPSNVRRRLAQLHADGVLYFDVEYDFRLFGLGVKAVLWLSVPPSLLAATGAALATHPEVAFCAATTGPANLFAVAVCADTPALYTYLTTRVAALPGVERTETLPVTCTIKGIAPVDGPVTPARDRPSPVPSLDLSLSLSRAGAAGRDAAGGSA